MFNKCFLCIKEIGEEENSNYILKNREKSFMLFEVLEISDRVIDLHENVEFQELYYCSKCLNRIIKISDMLEELETLEKNVLHEKYEVELYFKKVWTKYQNNLKDDEILHPMEQFRNKIVTELKCNSIQTMLNKMKNKKVGLKQNRTNTRTNVRIMKSVEIPKVMSSMTKDMPQRLEARKEISVSNINFMDEIPKSIRRPALTLSVNVITNNQIPETTCFSNFLKQIDHPHISENDDVPSIEIVHSNSDDEDLKNTVCIPESIFLPLENKVDLEEQHSISDPLSLDDSQSFENPFSNSLDVQKDLICGECGVNVCDYNLLAEHFEIHASNRIKHTNVLSLPSMAGQLTNTLHPPISSPLFRLSSTSQIFEDNINGTCNPSTSLENNGPRNSNCRRNKPHCCTHCKRWFVTKSHLSRHFRTTKHMRNVGLRKYESSKILKSRRTKKINFNSMDISTKLPNSDVSLKSVSQKRLEKQDIVQVQGQEQQQLPLEKEARTSSPLITLINLKKLIHGRKSTSLQFSSVSNVSNAHSNVSISMPLNQPSVSNPIQSHNNCINNMPSNRIPMLEPSAQLPKVSPIRFHSPGHGSTSSRYLNTGVMPRTNFHSEPSSTILSPRYNSCYGAINTNYEVRPTHFSTPNTEHYNPNPNCVTSFRGNTLPPHGFPTTPAFMSHRHMMMDQMNGEGLRYRLGSEQGFLTNPNVNFHSNYRLHQRNYTNP